MKSLCVLVMLGMPVSLQAKDVFSLPDNPKGIVVNYLEALKIEDPGRQLTQSEKHELARLFVKAYSLSVRKNRQDHLLRTGAPVYRLLLTNFPELKANEGEGGSVIFLGAIASFFNKSPEYRPDVLQVLRRGLSRQYCNRLS
jgi:hypothetical protein